MGCKQTIISETGYFEFKLLIVKLENLDLNIFPVIRKERRVDAQT